MTPETCAATGTVGSWILTGAAIGLIIAIFTTAAIFVIASYLRARAIERRRAEYARRANHPAYRGRIRNARNN